MHPKIDARKKVGSRTLWPGLTGTLREPFWPKRSPRGSILEVFLEPFSIKNAIQNRYRNRTSKKHEKHEKSIEKTMRKTMTNPDIFHEKYACKICKCVVFPEQEIDFIKIRILKSLFFIKNQSKITLERLMLETSKIYKT